MTDINSCGTADNAVSEIENMNQHQFLIHKRLTFNDEQPPCNCGYVYNYAII